MNTSEKSMARQIEEASASFQQQLTGHKPQAVHAMVGGRTVVVTLLGALSPAERVLAQNAAGAAKVQEFHRQLFATSSDLLRRDIMRITGAHIQEAAAEVEAIPGAVIHTFTTGTVVQVFLLARHPSGATPGNPAGEFTGWAP